MQMVEDFKIRLEGLKKFLKKVKDVKIVNM